MFAILTLYLINKWAIKELIGSCSSLNDAGRVSIGNS
jgi:hypothetical protein